MSLLLDSSLSLISKIGITLAPISSSLLLISAPPSLVIRRFTLSAPSPSIGSGYSRPIRKRKDDAAEVYKKNAINKLVEMVHGDLVLMRSAREAEAEGLLSLQAGLKRREDEINRGLKKMVDEKETLEQQLQVIAMNTDVLDLWIRENKGKAKNLLVDLDVDNAFECIESLSKQMLECNAMDLAIEDVVYSMDKSFRVGALPFDQYLRNVRFVEGTVLPSSHG